MKKQTGKDAIDTTQVVLSKPVTFDGVEYGFLSLNYDDLTGQDIINATKEAKALGDDSPVAELSKTYLAVIVAKAAKVPVDMILSLPAKDFTKATMFVQDFLLG